MKNDTYTEVSTKTKEEVAAIKADIKDIANRLANLKGEALHVLQENSEELISTMGEIKNKITNQSSDSLKSLYSCIEKNPLKSALYCFGAGVILTILLKK